MPTYDARRNLIANAVSQDIRVISAALSHLADEPPGFFLRLLTIKEAQMLSPGNIDEDSYLMFVGLVEEPFGRFVIRAN
jgi:hypothetical protein